MHKFILDIDGTLMNGNSAFPQSVQLIKYLQTNNIEFILATNSIKSPTVQVERLGAVGIEVSIDQIYNPIESINVFIQSNSISNALIVGSIKEIEQVLAKYNAQDPEIIILLDCEKNDIRYSELQRIISLIESDCPIITASRSPYYLIEKQKRIDTGAFVSLIESIVPLEIPVYGKPSLNYYLNARKKFKIDTGPIWSVGDDWQTDINGGESAGYSTVLVKTGKYQEGDEIKSTPDIILENLGDLISRIL